MTLRRFEFCKLVTKVTSNFGVCYWVSLDYWQRAGGKAHTHATHRLTRRNTHATHAHTHKHTRTHNALTHRHTQFYRPWQWNSDSTCATGKPIDGVAIQPDRIRRSSRFIFGRHGSIDKQACHDSSRSADMQILWDDANATSPEINIFIIFSKLHVTLRTRS